MAREGGGGGSALAWTLLGFLAGIAATLGVQMLMNREAPPPQVATAPAPAHIVVQTSPPPAAPAKKPVSVASAAPALSPAAKQAAAEVADDAAAAGMTSRMSRTTPTDSAGESSNN